jgi:hypothetical protein
MQPSSQSSIRLRSSQPISAPPIKKMVTIELVAIKLCIIELRAIMWHH